MTPDGRWREFATESRRVPDEERPPRKPWPESGYEQKHFAGALLNARVHRESWQFP